MYTSTRNRRTSGLKKTIWIYGVLAVFLGVFSVVYLQFSYGESSPFLVWLFAPALLLGMFPALLLARVRAAKRPGIAVRRVWNSAIATLSVGMLVRAVVNIAGRYTNYDRIYWIASGLLFLVAAALHFSQVARGTRPVLPERQGL